MATPVVQQSSQCGSNLEEPTEILSLTGIRFFAALYVVVFHTLKYFLPGLYQDQFVRRIADAGWLGVDLFFVLSGYILAQVYLRGKRGMDRQRFYIARFARVYPLYIFSLLVAFPILCALCFSTGYAGENWDQLLTKIGLHIFMLQAWPAAYASKWNPPSWSLSAETLFYYLFPAIGAKLWRSKRPFLAMIYLSLLGVAQEMIFSIMSSHRVIGVTDTPHSLPLLRLPQFLLGILAARALLPRRFGPAAVVTAFCVIGMAVMFPSSIILHSLGPVFALLISGLSSAKGFIAKVFANRPVVLLGNASYAIYLLHWPLRSWFFAIQDHDLRQPNLIPRVNAPLLYGLYLVILIGLSLITLRWIETPARRAIRRRLAA